MKQTSLTLCFLFMCTMLFLRGFENKTHHTGPRTFTGKIGETRTDTIEKRHEIYFYSYSPITEKRKKNWALTSKRHK